MHVQSVNINMQYNNIVAKDTWQTVSNKCFDKLENSQNVFIDLVLLVSPGFYRNMIMCNLAHWSAAQAAGPARLSLVGHRPANCDGAYWFWQYIYRGEVQEFLFGK